MSRVYFHSPHGTAEVRGTERAHASLLVNEIALACCSYRERSFIEPLLPPDCYLRSIPNIGYRDWWDGFKTWFFASHDGHLLVGGRELSCWELALNTAIVIGSDVINWCARLHATCEIYGYVEGVHRTWLADIIERGRVDNVLRPEMGWEEVVTLLRSRDDEPVVMSYSVTETFPNRTIAGWRATRTTEDDEDEDDEDDDRWYDLPVERQWELAMKGLREQNTRAAVDLHPGMWRTRGFGHGYSVFDFLELARTATGGA